MIECENPITYFEGACVFHIASHQTAFDANTLHFTPMIAGTIADLGCEGKVTLSTNPEALISRLVKFEAIFVYTWPYVDNVMQKYPGWCSSVDRKDENNESVIYPIQDILYNLHPEKKGIKMQDLLKLNVGYSRAPFYDDEDIEDTKDRLKKDTFALRKFLLQKKWKIPT